MEIPLSPLVLIGNGVTVRYLRSSWSVVPAYVWEIPGRKRKDFSAKCRPRIRMGDPEVPISVTYRLHYSPTEVLHVRML